MKSQNQESSTNSFKIVSQKLIIAIMLVVGVASFAQGQNQGGKKSNKPKKEQKTPEQQNQERLDKMTTELNLDANQQEQIKSILAEQTTKLEAMKAERKANGGAKEMSDEEKEAFKEKRKEDKKATDAKLKTILTPEQFKKMKDNEKANREKMKQSRENRPSREEE